MYELMLSVVKKYESLGIPKNKLIESGEKGMEKAIDTYTENMTITLATHVARCIELQVKADCMN